MDNESYVMLRVKWILEMVVILQSTPTVLKFASVRMGEIWEIIPASIRLSEGMPCRLISHVHLPVLVTGLVLMNHPQIPMMETWYCWKCEFSCISVSTVIIKPRSHCHDFFFGKPQRIRIRSKIALYVIVRSGWFWFGKKNRSSSQR